MHSDVFREEVKHQGSCLRLKGRDDNKVNESHIEQKHFLQKRQLAQQLQASLAIDGTKKTSRGYKRGSTSMCTVAMIKDS